MSSSEVLDFEKICRLCLSEKRSMSAIFSKKKSDCKVPLSVRIMSCGALQLYEGDGLPASICSKCLANVNQSYAFREQCEQADNTLRQYLQRKNEIADEEEPKIEAELQLETEPEPEMDLETENEPEASTANNQEDEMDSNSYVDTSKFLETTFIDDPGKVLTFNDDQIQLEAFNKRQQQQKQGTPAVTNGKSTVNKAELIEKLKVLSDSVTITSTSGKVMEKPIDVLKSSQLLKCRFCSRSFSNKYVLVEHEKLHSGYSITLVPPSASSSVLYFNSCPRSFYNRVKSDQHEEVHKNHTCQLCGRVFQNLRNMYNHRKRCGAEKKFACNTCNRQFFSSTELNNHLKIHTGEKPYMCEHCYKVFRMKNALDRHKITHTDLKPFKCVTCGRGFNKRWNYTQHLRLHTGERPYACDVCGEAFRHNVTLKEHKLKHNIS